MDDSRQILITGASGGIGSAIAEAAAKAGYTVVAHYNKGTAAINALVEKIKAEGGKIRTLQFDICNREECREVIQKDIRENGAYYGIVSNAGVCEDTLFATMKGEAWDKVLDTNLGGFFNVVQPAVLPMCGKRQGRIIAISSVSGVIGNKGQVNYSASKAGLIGAVKSLALELASRNITVNCIAPGFVETDMTKNLPTEEILKEIPLKRLGQPKDIAEAAIFLLSEGAAYITRQVISVNGGLA